MKEKKQSDLERLRASFPCATPATNDEIRWFVAKQLEWQPEDELVGLSAEDLIEGRKPLTIEEVVRILAEEATFEEDAEDEDTTIAQWCREASDWQDWHREVLK